jgi:hypothetical protein
MNQKVLWFGIPCMMAAGVISIIAHVYAQQEQQIQQPPFTNQPLQPPFTNQPQQQPFQQPQQQNPGQYAPQLQPNQLQQQQTNPGQQQYPPQLLYNEPAVISCLNHALVDSIVKAGTTGALILKTNGTSVVTGLNQTFINNATNTLDACILPRR